MRCECFDKWDGHPLHNAAASMRKEGEGARCTESSRLTLYRLDMTDKTGTAFCPHCADDALESGLYVTGKERCY